MSYVNITNGKVDQYPYTVGLLRRDNPNTSFPRNISEATLNQWGVFSVEETEEPVISSNNQYTVESDPVLQGGVWKATWQVVSRTSEEQELYDQNVSTSNRHRRDGKLAATDWWASSDLTMTSAQTTYRKALRDIPTHSNWPHLADNDWPTKP